MERRGFLEREGDSHLLSPGHVLSRPAGESGADRNINELGAILVAAILMAALRYR